MDIEITSNDLVSSRQPTNQRPSTAIGSQSVMDRMDFLSAKYPMQRAKSTLEDANHPILSIDIDDMNADPNSPTPSHSKHRQYTRPYHERGRHYSAQPLAQNGQRYL